MNQVHRADGFALCYQCKLRHPCFSHQGYLDFLERHQGHHTSFLNRDALDRAGHSTLAAWDPRKLLVAAFGYWDVLKLRVALEGFAPNADVKTALQTVQTMTVTNLHSLANSVTAGWQSAEVDNTSNLYLDSLLQIVLDFANTAPANSKGVFIFAASGIETAKLSNPFSGSEGTLTLLDVTANAQAARQIGFLPYTTTDEVAEATPVSMASANNGIHPPFWAIGLMNNSGAALAASGNTVKYRGVYATVV